MKNISEACRKIGVSRQHYYDIKNTLAEEGIEGLIEKTRKGARLKNRFDSENFFGLLTSGNHARSLLNIIAT